MANKASQRAMIKEHLEVHGSITQDEAKSLYAIGRLSARIGEMHDDMPGIVTVMVKGLNRFGEKCRFGKYVYTGEVKGSCAECGSFAPNNVCPSCAPRRRM